MMSQMWKESYFDYLTKRLDGGETNNIAISQTVEIIKEKLQKQDVVSIVDIGCFSGAMLNRIAECLSTIERNRIKLIGVDFDKEVMKRGALKYKDIIFVYSQIENDLPLIGQYDIVLLSNVLHEIAPQKRLDERKRKIRSVFKKMSTVLRKDGCIIILDGLRPAKNKKLKVEFLDNNGLKTFITFASQYKAFKVHSRVKGKTLFTDALGITAFLTKARYMKEDYWHNESSQIYQYFTLNEFKKMLKDNHFVVQKAEPQLFSYETLAGIFKKVSSTITSTAKNVLIVGQLN